MNPPKLKETPATNPELMEHWQRSYAELIAINTKSRTLEIIGDRSGVSRQTVMYHLFPSYKSEKIKRDAKQWHFQKQDPVTRKRIINYKATYMAARYHIDDLIRMCYQKPKPHDMMTLEDLSYGIQSISGILFKPSTLLGLSQRFKSKKGYPLLEGVTDNDVSHYRLFKK